MSLSKNITITGYSEMAPVAQLNNTTLLEIITQQSYAAIKDAGLTPDHVDGLCTGLALGDLSTLWPSALVEHLGLQTTYKDLVQLGGASACGMIWRAANAIDAGMCNSVLCVLADNFSKSSTMDLARTIPKNEFEFNLPYGLFGTNAQYALIAKRHMHEFETTAEQLAKIAVDQRTNANHNPSALFHDQALTIEDVLQSRMIYDPLHLYEIVKPCSGAGAFIITKSSMARHSKNRPVYLLGAGEASYRHAIAHDRNLTSSAVRFAAQRAFNMAGLLPADMDFVQPYDCYTIMVAMTLEDAGFCKKGYAGAFVYEHDLTFSGDFPCNTHGGQLSFGQPGIAGGLSHVLEAIRQLMGRAENRQIPNAQFGYVNGNGGEMSEEVSVILGVE